ncbi:MAG TPA: FG-GAP-like repeat-containing protein [Gemmatimonadales bacterium]|nr:FG-GAP-like repeat-containing protein [Gemmatimonadales bacterium]
MRSKVVLGLILAAAFGACRPEQHPTESVFRVRSLGLDHLQRGELPEAEAQFKKLIALAPREPLGYANLGITYMRAGRYTQAETELARALRLDPANAEIGLAIARLHALDGRVREARATLEQLSRSGPNNPRVLYALAELDGQDADRLAQRRREDRLRQVLGLAPANLAVRVALLDQLIRRGEADSAVRHLEEVRRLPPELPAEARTQLERSIQLLRAGRFDEAASLFRRFQRAVELTSAYQASLGEVSWIEGPLVGRPVFNYTPSFLIALRSQQVAPVGLARFTDATGDAGLPEPGAAPAPRDQSPVALAVGDLDGDGGDDVFHYGGALEQRAARARLYRGAGGQFVDVTDDTGIALPGGATHAAFGDSDNDGRLDLFLIDTEGRGRLFLNSESGRFADMTARAGIGGGRGARLALFVDLDHDGDLDVFLAGNGERLVYRNNLDGTFTEVAGSMGLGGVGSARAAAFGDFDDDGRTDLFVANESGSDLLFRNAGTRRFADVTAQSGLATPGGSGAAAAGDYDNDGLLDLFVASGNGGQPVLWRNGGNGTFTRDSRSSAVFERLRSTAAHDAEFVDYDNDGWLDLVVVGSPRAATASGAFLYHNDGSGKYRDRSELLPGSVRSAGGTAVAPSDVDGDGDLDLLVAGSEGVRLLRNEDGNTRLSMQVRLLALRTGSGKNNTFGIGAKVEVRASEIYQMRVVTAPTTHVGLGSHLKADVLRIQWPNGVPQTVYLPGTDQDVLELEQLKGSCAFLYTWDGERFRFVTDVMWRSALGMPLGIMGGGGTAWAPAGASQEYLRVPGEALIPRGGRYVLQFTEELWETAYLDETRLLALDHPESVAVFVDERFVPPAPVHLRLFPVVRPRPPRTARDERGADLLPALRRSDDLYVSNLTPLQFQGLVEPHELIMELDPDAGRPGTYLFLRGWIYPTDASINVALSQQSRLRVQLPSLEVRDARGRWTTAVASIGFPSGKDKTIVVDLAGLFPTSDRHIRIRTNMQIYWDHAFVASRVAESAVRVTPLTVRTADLHYRGFSRMYRRGGRYGPHWFTYDDVTRESPWRPIEGAFTRFGDVLALLERADDMYVVMGPGDELTVEFDAASAAVPQGWKRTFLLYTDGWIKDADMNTAFGNTVEPLPFHANRQYPYAEDESYPTGAAHQRYLREYNTRVVRRR